MEINVKSLEKNYKSLKVIDDVSFSIEKQETLGLLGPNGAGKTTIIGIMLGLIKSNGGFIEIFGKDIARHSREVNANIGFVPQDVALFDELSAYDNVTFFGKLYGLRGSLLKERVKEALEFTDLWDRRKDHPKKYSGGMKRRLNIACGIVHHPRLLILDEPTVGVDPQSRNRILESVRTLNANGMTVLYTSHYMEEVEELCSRIIIIDKGKVIANGTSEAIKSSVVTSDVFEIEVDQKNRSICEFIGAINGVFSCEMTDKTLHIVSAKGTVGLNRIIDTIVEQQLKVLSVKMEKPTLDTAFLTLTGKTLRD